MRGSQVNSIRVTRDGEVGGLVLYRPDLGIGLDWGKGWWKWPDSKGLGGLLLVSGEGVLLKVKGCLVVWYGRGKGENDETIGRTRDGVLVVVTRAGE